MSAGPGDRVYNNTHSPVDAELQLEDGAALIAASGAGSDILDLGDDGFDDAAGVGAYVKGKVLVLVSALEFGTGDETYDIRVQLSTSATFASDIVDRAVLPLGDAVAPRDVDVTGLGKYLIPVDNELNIKRYRYMRIYVTVGGTIATGIMFEAWLTKDN